MLKRPSSRRKTARAEITLNLVPIIDAMVTLVGFLLFTTAFLAIVSIESPFPQMSKDSIEKSLKDNEHPLQLTLSLREKDSEIWSPFAKIPPKIIPNTATGSPDDKAIHEALIAVKQQFPEETKIVFVPHAAVSYDTMIVVMDAMRVVLPTDPPLFKKNKVTGNDEVIKSLFSDVIFGNLLGVAE